MSKSKISNGVKKVLIFVIFIVLVVGAALIFDENKSMKKEDSNFSKNEEELVREPVAAGSFYPGLKEELENMIDKYMLEVESPTSKKHIRALIVPHAGYQFSGQVAAYAYKALIGNLPAGGINTVIIIGPSHHEYFEGASVYPKGYYKTPLGKIEIDKDLAKKIIDSDKRISFQASAHSQEHSIEVQLPFLQEVLPAIGWKIVPIIMGNQPEAVDILINSLKNLIDENTLLFASSDLSHYPSYEDAKYSDNKVIKAILTGKKENLENTIEQLKKENIPNLQTCACGQDAIEVVMGVMEDKEKSIKLLKYANSGDVEIGNKSQVVGYAAIVFMDSTSSSQPNLELSKEERKKLLEIAQESVETYVKTKKILQFKNDLPALEKHLGAFVTIKKSGQLRGCIGIFEPKIPLYQVVIEMAISAATKDSRFYPITEDELKDLKYEISVLSPLKKVNSWRDIEIGKHGVQVKQGLHSGVFLPQVATENNWDLDSFMSQLCSQKAGLPADCWKNPETDIYIFTAQVFGEKDL